MPLPKALASLPKLPCVVELNAYLDNSKFEGLIIIAPKGEGDARCSQCWAYACDSCSRDYK